MNLGIWGANNFGRAVATCRSENQTSRPRNQAEAMTKRPRILLHDPGQARASDEKKAERVRHPSTPTPPERPKGKTSGNRGSDHHLPLYSRGRPPPLQAERGQEEVFTEGRRGHVSSSPLGFVALVKIQEGDDNYRNDSIE